MTRRTLEIESLAELDSHLATTTRLNGWFIQALDLTARDAALRGTDPWGAIFLGCRLRADTESFLRERGALLFPRLPQLPFDPYRSQLYDADELYGDGSYEASADARIHAWSLATAPGATVQQTLAQALHDHSVADALDEALEPVDPRRIVGIMGGHAVVRGAEEYRVAVELGRELTSAGRTVLTGGGPGAMEAANLGGYLSPWPEAVEEAVEILAEASTYRPSTDAWLQAGMRVRRRWPPSRAGRSIGIPTWFYGHEPTNVFATQIAKYFTNALREDTLLHRCRGGIIYLPGRAGTVQEIFQAATENFYAAAPDQVAPMVLVGKDYWTSRYPAYPLLRALSSGRTMAGAVHCVDSVSEACQIVLG